jgi:outer membrane protein TolC
VPIFIANNAVREYVTQGVVTETVGLGRIAALRLADAQAAVAKAKLEIARRGLVSTVVTAYYTVLSDDAKLQVATVALEEANRFVQVSQQLEQGGEAAHADVLRAQLQQEQRQRELTDARLADAHARLELGVLLFADPTTPYTLAADLDHTPPLGTREQFAEAAKNANPDVQAALASVQAAQLTIASSQDAYLPDLSLAYNYGIDSDHLAIKEPTGVRNLGYAVTATLDIPVWDWFATRAKIHQSVLARDLAKANLTIAQRRALAAFQEFYGEADVANQQMASLDRSVKDAAEVLRLTDLRYKAGEGTVLEVVDAENTLVSAETARADGVVRYYTALANLQTLTGTMP